MAGIWVSRVSHTSLTDKGGAVGALCTDSVFMWNTARQRGSAWPGPSKHLRLRVAFLGNHMAHMLLPLVAEGECALRGPHRRERACGSSHTDSSSLHLCPFPSGLAVYPCYITVISPTLSTSVCRVLSPPSEFSNKGAQNPREERSKRGVHAAAVPEAAE